MSQKRVFPWTIETQHDANVLKKQQNIFQGIDTENILNSLPRLNGIEMFRPDSPKLLMKSTVEKYKQLMLEEEEEEKNALGKKGKAIVVTTKVEDDENKANKVMVDFTRRNSNNDLSQMKHELKSLKKSLRDKSANIALGGKSKTLERIGYKTHKQLQRRRRRRQVRAKSLPKLNRALLPSQLNTTATTTTK